MTKKAEFNADEWAAVVEGPVLAGMRVITADRGGTIRESIAMGKVYAEARKQQGQSELLDELAASPPAIDQGKASQAGGDVKAYATERLGQAVKVVADKASAEELEAYKRFTVAVAQAAAAAHKEGGFMGVGGTLVSEAEQTAIDEIQATLESSP